MILHAAHQHFLLRHCHGVVEKQEEQAERFAAYRPVPELGATTRRSTGSRRRSGNTGCCWGRFAGGVGRRRRPWGRRPARGYSGDNGEALTLSRGPAIAGATK